MFLRIAVENREERKQRLAAQRAYKQQRAAKLERTRHGGAQSEAKLANIFYHMGLLTEFEMDRAKAFRLIPFRLEGQKRDNVSALVWDFLQENFSAVVVSDPQGRKLIHIPKLKERTEMILVGEIADKSGLTRKDVKAFFVALVEVVQESLKAERKVRLPDLGTMRLKFKKALPKRKGKNFFTGEMQWFKARPATNKLRFTPAKSLREYVAEEIPVKEPKARKKRK